MQLCLKFDTFTIKYIICIYPELKVKTTVRIETEIITSQPLWLISTFTANPTKSSTAALLKAFLNCIVYPAHSLHTYLQGMLF